MRIRPSLSERRHSHINRIVVIARDNTDRSLNDRFHRKN